MSVIDRAKNIILRPKLEWPVIDAEQTTISQIYQSYVIPLAAIGPIASLIGMTVFGMPIPFVGTVRVPVTTAVGRAVLSYVLSLVAVYVLALIIDALAPNFGGTKNRVQAFKVSAYSATASWVAGIFGLIPALGVLAILGLYSLYLLYTGLPVLMKSPADRSLGYTVVVVIAAIVIFVIIGVIVGTVFAVGSIATRPAM
jgi:hypothetical protein